ncbi:uncharacterized protein TNIN_355261 [Trichonephila inaurata madagascariensis]|uniref:Uncharacterized protein n=1 Tax=Trichonephila inaurata madagascariensis TaxID=2747483 RepID=A0A8X6XDX6_9ARAC|nr:uncharacterized protein TNIN_355261 [Trichonephila inaurata madagascariensis]
MGKKGRGSSDKGVFQAEMPRFGSRAEDTDGLTVNPQRDGYFSGDEDFADGFPDAVLLFIGLSCFLENVPTSVPAGATVLPGHW